MNSDQTSSDGTTEGPDKPERKGKDHKRGAAVDQAFRRTGNTTQAILNDAIEILYDKRMPHLDHGPVAAYGARNKGEVEGFPYFALICENNLVPRTRQAPLIAGINSPGLARLIASGVCYWPPGGGERYAFVYENNLGHPILKPGDSGLGWRAEQVLQTVIRPAVLALSDLRDADVYHGSIRPSNMFDGGAKVVERVIFGDCLSTPPSYTQPAVYESIERAMADPLSRGRGTYEDDLYSFGVSLAVLLRHRDPMEGMNDEEIVKHKIENGSYTALTGNERFTGAILELLRGLLYDDPSQRWTLAEISSWLDGQRLSPKQITKKIKAARPLQFNNDKYFRPSILAMDLNKNQPEAVHMVENGALGQWIERSLEDRTISNRLQESLDAAQETGRGPGYWDRLLARVSIALDISAPLRYKGLVLNPDGIPFAMADAMIRKKDIQPYIDIINQQLVTYWVTIQNDALVDIGALVSRFDSSRAFLKQQTMGYGIERCLYFLCQEAPCISDILKGYYVRSPEDLMYAYEDIAKKPNRPHLFIDRHIAAFLSVKDKRVIDPFLADLNAGEFHRRIMGNVKVLALLQKRSHIDSLPGVAAWAAEILKPVYERLHDRHLREKLKQKIDRTAAAGDLNRVAAILDDPMMRQNDMLEFKQAMRDYSSMRDELAKLEADLSKPQSFGREAGHEYAAIASAVIGGIAIMAVAFMHFMKGSS